MQLPAVVVWVDGVAYSSPDDVALDTRCVFGSLSGRQNARIVVRRRINGSAFEGGVLDGRMRRSDMPIFGG